MGVCCSKKHTGVVSPFIPEAKRNDDFNGLKIKEQGQINLLSAPSLILGRHERTLQARQFLPYDAHTMQKPKAATGQPWTDKTFPHVFEKDKEGKTIIFTWKRPVEFTSNVRLFGDTINRYCVKQGQVSDCFFMSTLSAIADHKDYITQIFPEDAYETDPRKHTGVVHCRFWWMGEWIDVYTDDVLPCYDNLDQYVGGHSDDKRTVWVPLVEKALARLYGSYPKIAGNQSEVFRLLTGGLVEDFKTSKAKKDDDDILPPQKLFERVDKALKSGSTVLTNISEKVAEKELKGLVSHHAYSVTGVLKVGQGEKVTRLLRIRNPWGEKEKTNKRVNDGEWKGRWSYASKEWKEADEALRNKYNVHIDKGGEFWVCMEDFYKLFENLYVCDRIPNFDKDGFRKEDGLDKVINILGEWHGVTAAGNEDKNKMRNPRFILTIPEQTKMKAVGVVIEITRQFENPANSFADNEKLFGMIDLFKVEKEEVRNSCLWMSLNKQDVEKSQIGCRTSTYLCKLSPGNYLLVPYYYDSHAKPPVSKSFCIRIFTNVNTTCRQLLEYPVALTGKPCETFESIGNPPDKQVFATNIFGEWKEETAAGSDRVNRLKNPRFLLTIPENRKAKIGFQLRTRTDINKDLHCRLNVFKIDADTIRSNRRWMVLNEITNMETFMGGGEVSYEYELASGKYLLLPNYLEKGQIGCAFCIRILAFVEIQCSPQTENPVLFVREAENVLKNGNQSFSLGKIDFVFGEWVKKLTAGGQICHNSFAINPQYGLSVAGNGPQPVLIDLLQETVEPIHSIGCHIIQVDEGQNYPIENELLRRNPKVKTVKGGTHAFMTHYEANDYYMLSPGRYIILVFAHKPTDEKKFAVVIVTQAQSKISLREPK